MFINGEIKVASILKSTLSVDHRTIDGAIAAKLLKDFNVEYAKLPKISITDPAIDNLDAKFGDVVKITRKSPTSGTTVYYRMVIEQ